MRRALVVALIVGVVGLAAVSVGCQTTEGLQHQIEAKVKPGSSVDEIRTYLATDGTKLGIISDGRVSKAGLDSNLEEAHVPHETDIVSAGIPDHGNPGFEIYFVVDQNDRLDRVIVTKYYTGP